MDKLEELGMFGVVLINLGFVGGFIDGIFIICCVMDDFVVWGYILVCGVGDDGGVDNFVFVFVVLGNVNEI